AVREFDGVGVAPPDVLAGPRRAADRYPEGLADQAPARGVPGDAAELVLVLLLLGGKNEMTPVAAVPAPQQFARLDERAVGQQAFRLAVDADLVEAEQLDLAGRDVGGDVLCFLGRLAALLRVAQPFDVPRPQPGADLRLRLLL